MKTQSISTSIATGILVMINLIGNCVICAVVLRNRSMRTPINFLLLNLAVADLYIGVCALPVRVFGPVYTHPDGELGSWLCKLVTGDHVMYSGVTVSAFNLSAIAYERYLAVVYPFDARKMVTSRKVFLFIVVDWFLAIAIVSCFWFITVFDIDTQYCAIDPRFHRINSLYTMLYGCFAFGVPFILMLVLYGTVVWELIKKRRQVVSMEKMSVNRFKKRITLMLLTVTVIFMATWGVAAAIVLTVNGYHPGTPSAIACTFLICSNSSVNCFVYNVFSSQFRKGLRNLLCCRGANYPEKQMKNERDRNVEKNRIVGSAIMPYHKTAAVDTRF